MIACEACTPDALGFVVEGEMSFTDFGVRGLAGGAVCHYLTGSK